MRKKTSSEMTKPADSPAPVIVPLRLTREMDNEIQRVATAASLSKADIMRLAMERGIEAVEKMFKIQPKKAA